MFEFNDFELGYGKMIALHFILERSYDSRTTAVADFLSPLVASGWTLKVTFREFLVPSTSVISGKDSKIVTGDVTLKTCEMKYYMCRYSAI